ncbi:DUF6924 domain-containing protein [Micromonospora sp. NPDC005087]|uniref:DUF6924 domain-containing protein n=1 Tax=Micromonospora sp. NPDC005087 TaxID=3364225 RepID=UPI00369A7137
MKLQQGVRVGGVVGGVVEGLYDEPGRTFRVPLRWYAEVSANMSITNMDFADFADTADESGTFRGFEGE